MLETLLITFREGLEAFLIVAIMLAYLKNTGRLHLIKPVYAGVAVALLISATTGWHVAELAEDPAWEGSLSLIAGAMVASFTVYIMRTAKTIRQEIGNSLEKRAQQEGIWAEFGVFFFTILMVAREGMETALMLGSITAQNDGTMMLAGGIAGLACVALIAYLWTSQSRRINLRLFLQVTGIFLVLFSVHLFIYGLHELSEMNAIPLIGDDMNTKFHIMTEPVEEAGGYITTGLMIVPMLWLLGSFLRDKFAARPAPSAAE